jgi:putative intracellular protease/amidase
MLKMLLNNSLKLLILSLKGLIIPWSLVRVQAGSPVMSDELKRLGGFYEKASNWQSFIVVDGHLITRQNPASSSAPAREV